MAFTAGVSCPVVAVLAVTLNTFIKDAVRDHLPVRTSMRVLSTMKMVFFTLDLLVKGARCKSMRHG
jgi:hypothetical protein